MINLNINKVIDKIPEFKLDSTNDSFIEGDNIRVGLLSKSIFQGLPFNELVIQTITRIKLHEDSKDTYAAEFLAKCLKVLEVGLIWEDTKKLV